MKTHFVFFPLIVFLFICTNIQAQPVAKDTTNTANHFYIDVHHLPSGKVKFEDVAAAHAKDLAVENKHGVQFLQYWVDEPKGIIYCLSAAPDTMAIQQTHREAHGLLAKEIYEVTDGLAALPKGNNSYFLDVHTLGAGKVTAADVAKAHEKDLAVEKKYNVHFINYWVNEKDGIVLCLSQAKDSSKVIQTHKEAHGLLPDYIAPVKQGQ